MDQLFTVVKERVCALVSRVQGTYEFEVQPLREYFCAKYLYETSPYSPAGFVKFGTKPERFDAISRNSYWQNVVRFFAGCFDKGELPMLIQKLNDLQNDELLKYTNYPRIITSQLLSDWVFTQYPNLLKEVVKILIIGNRFDIIEKNSTLKEKVFNGILDSEIFVSFNRNIKTKFLSIVLLSFYLDTSILSSVFDNDNDSNSLLEFINQQFPRHRFLRENEKEMRIPEFIISDEIDIKIKNYFNLIKNALDTEISNWKKDIEPWDVLVENGRSIFNDNWGFYLVSIIAAGIKTNDKKFNDYHDFNNSKISLCKRVRYARLKSGNIKWWQNHIKNSTRLDFSLLVFFAWATPKTIIQLLPLILPKIESLKPEEFKKIINGLKRISRVSIFTPVQQKNIINEVKKHNLSDSIKYILSLRFPDMNKQKFIYEYINNYSGDLEDVLESQLEFLINQFLTSSSKDAYLPKIKKIYCNLKRYKRKHHFYGRYLRVELIKIPYEIID